MTYEDAIKFLDENKGNWFDNSKISQIRGCKRKAMLSLLGPPRVGLPPAQAGLAASVGDGANFGSAFHAGLHSYYMNWGLLDEPQRRLEGIKGFSEEWSKFFPSKIQQNKHRLDRGIDLLDAYFERWLDDDLALEPVESELGFLVQVKPDQPGDPEFSPFWYVGRIDRVFKRKLDDTFWLHEFKSCGRDAENRLKQLKFDHQPIGYTAIMRHQNPNYEITGFLGDVALVAAKSVDFHRNFFPIQQRDTVSWRNQLIHTVEDWRRMQRIAEQQSSPREVLNVFYQDTNRCFDYGRCSFYDICDFGISESVLQDFSSNDWNPLAVRPPEKIVELVS
jgi:hypothetical protein